MKSTEILNHKKIINIFLNDNKLTLEIYGYFTDIIIKDVLSKLQLFLNICEKKSKKFYLIFDFSKYNILYSANLLYYMSNISNFLKKNNNIIKTYLIGSIIITETHISKTFMDTLLSNYTPVRPYKFFSANEKIHFDFV